jgi:anti-anti-sigma factor
MRADAAAKFPRPAARGRVRPGAARGALGVGNAGEFSKFVFGHVQEKDLILLVIDAAEIVFVDSAGLRCLVALRHLAERRHLDFHLIPSSALRHMLDLTGFDALLGVAPPADPDDT